MSKFKVGDTVCFGDDGVKRTGRIVRIIGLFRKEYLIEHEGISLIYLFDRREKDIYKPLETIKEPINGNEVQND
ncbi:hypothetical protein [Metaclostridioides mangenotii]|uniref:KOW domain-containing protein n=1 Tax=Metaclostridioides mangenotii TaxID=1540 RepID=A0ABS4EBR6_9FIRM|nr:hypothetical protein [Clostridioides mangenotii]MBP1855383.1 hypothetical protein [Clostridioides mangenotii]